MRKKILRVLPLTAMLIVFNSILFVFSSCLKTDFPGTIVKNYPPDVAIAWIKMQQKLFVGTPGLLPHVTGRTYAYVGLTMYEAIAAGMVGYQSIAPQLNGELALPPIEQGKKYYWPASANSAVAFILKNLLPHTSTALMSSIDSLEKSFNTTFQAHASPDDLQRSVEYGKQIANVIFEWSKTDGGHEAYKSPFSQTYISPAGPGNWEPTGEYPFSQPVYPYWGDNRTFIPSLAVATQPPPPPSYSEQPGSVFYSAANEIYTMSKHLSHKDSMTARFWAYDLLNVNEAPVYEDVSHAASIATQLILLKKLSLQDAAILYCKHSIAVNDGGISSVKTKFQYNVVRPITYIRKVMGHSEWRPIVHTPPFPEYTSAHAVISMACASILENTFGKNFQFTDHSFDNTYGPRTFDSFEEYAKEAALSRLQAGIHYRFGMDEGLKQGKQVAVLVNQLRFKK